jgi:hypothetical protein
MKKTLLALALVAACVPAFSQGKVSFGNDSLHYYSIGPSVLPGDTAGLIPVSPLPSGVSLQATLYAGTTAGSLSLQTTLVLDAVNWLTDGRQINKNVILVGVPGAAVANFQIVLTTTGATLPGTIDNGTPLTAALFGGTSYFGTSGAFTATPGASLSYPGLISGGPAGSTWNPGTVAINAVPEPSSMVLAGLGAASLLMFRRRK